MKLFFAQYKKAVFHTAFFICVVLFSGGCSKTPEEEQIQLILNNMIAVVESGKPAELAEHLHENFRANAQMDAKQAKQMLMMYGIQHARISVNVISSQTLIDPVYTDKASTTLSVAVMGSTGRGLPEDSRVRVIKLEWLKDSDWKLLGADWEM